MDTNSIITLVQSVGFPIVCCCALFWKMNKDSELHKEEMDKITEALNNNTSVMTRLEEMIKGGIGNGSE